MYALVYKLVGSIQRFIAFYLSHDDADNNNNSSDISFLQNDVYDKKKKTLNENETSQMSQAFHFYFQMCVYFTVVACEI